MFRLICLALAVVCSSGAHAFAATFEKAFLGVKSIEIDSGTERFVVSKALKTAGNDAVFTFFPIDLKLQDSDGSPGISIVVSRSPIFENDLALNLTATLAFSASKGGLAALENEIKKEFSGQKFTFAPLGSIRYKLYLFESATADTPGDVTVTKLDEGSANISSSIAVAFKIDAISVDKVKSLFARGKSQLTFVATFQFEYDIYYSQTAGQDLPAGALAKLFKPDANAPLASLYEKQLATSSPDTIELQLKSVDDLAPVIFGSTPKIGDSSSNITWNLSEDRLNAIKNSETSTSKTFRVRDLASFVYPLPSICDTYSDQVVDVDNLGPFCD